MALDRAGDQQALDARSSISASTVTGRSPGTEATGVARSLQRRAHHHVLVRSRPLEQLADVDRERRCCDVLAHRNEQLSRGAVAGV